MEKLELELKLTIAHVNLILKHLSQGAYAEVSDLITLLHGQAKPQVEAATATQQITSPESTLSVD
jgi:hypothetical protein